MYYLYGSIGSSGFQVFRFEIRERYRTIALTSENNEKASTRHLEKQTASETSPSVLLMVLRSQKVDPTLEVEAPEILDEPSGVDPVPGGGDPLAPFGGVLEQLVDHVERVLALLARRVMLQELGEGVRVCHRQDRIPVFEVSYAQSRRIGGAQCFDERNAFEVGNAGDLLDTCVLCSHLFDPDHAGGWQRDRFPHGRQVPQIWELRRTGQIIKRFLQEGIRHAQEKHKEFGERTSWHEGLRLAESKSFLLSSDDEAAQA